MKRAVQVLLGAVFLILLGGVGLFFWERAGAPADREVAQTKSYSFAPASPDRDTFTVMTYNLDGLSRGSSASDDPGRRIESNLRGALDLIRDVRPDVIGFQNIDLGAEASNRGNHLDTIATQLEYTAAAQALSGGGSGLLFTGGGASAETGSGQAILSRYPLRRHVRRVLPGGTSLLGRGAGAGAHLVQVTAVDIGGWPLLVMNAHFDASDVEAREEQARVVNQLYLRLAGQGFRVLLIGSFNSQMPSAQSFGPVGENGEETDNTMQILLDGTGLQPAFSSESARLTGRSVGTYPADEPAKTLDYIFYPTRVIIPTGSEIVCGQASSPPSNHCAVAMSFLFPRQKDKYPEMQIPDDRLPSLDSLLQP